MLNIEKSAAQAHQYLATLATSGFAGSLSGQKFTMIPMDLMIEITIKKSSKVLGGLSGLTESGQLSQHAEFRKIRVKLDEDHVERVVAGLKLLVPDMWKKERPLVND